MIHLEDEGEGRTLEDLEDWECSQIIESEILDNVDYYWTEWDECGEDPRIYEK